MAENPATEWFDPRRRAPGGFEATRAAEIAQRLPLILAKARDIAASLVHGAHGRRRAGMGDTFWQYRPFASGEEAQRIDWRRSARSDQLFVREREWEAAHNCFVWIDVTPSMAFKSALANDFKIDRAAILGLAVADALVNGGERVGALGLSTPTAARNVMIRLGELFAKEAASGEAEKLPPTVPLPPRARAVLISDFFCDPQALATRLAAYSDCGARGALLMLLDPVEEAFPFAGETLFRDPLGGEDFRAGEARALREAYGAKLAEHQDALREAARRAGFLFLVHHTDRPAAEAALALLMGLGDGAEALRWA
ncbi:MAG TPA: DUF58 domain-containing protein [Methylocystis sp.]|nr:DUF58 domain-containing protein [Methylocystis sp.]